MSLIIEFYLILLPHTTPQYSDVWLMIELLRFCVLVYKRVIIQLKNEVDHFVLRIVERKCVFCLNQ